MSDLKTISTDSSSNSLPNSNQETLSDWNYIEKLLPNNWQSSCKSFNVLKGNRKIKCPSVLLRVLLLHIGRGYSLSETSVRSKLSGLLDISDVGILNILQRSELWLKDMCENLYLEQEGSHDSLFGKKKMRLIDGSVVKEPGKTGSIWRINYSFSLPSFECDYFDLVNSKGKGNGESVTRYPIKKDECIIADRNYSNFKQISYAKEKNADIIVRVNTNSLPLYSDSSDKGSKEVIKFDLLKNLNTLKKAGDYNEWSVYIKDSSISPKNNDKNNNSKIYGRICAIKKDDLAIEESIKKIKRVASRKCGKTRAKTFEYAKYIIIFTTLTKEEYSTNSILEWYRVRWQIELAFKRLKSITGLGHLPKYNDKSSRSWIYGKLLLALLTEKLIRYSRTVSPWGYCFKSQTQQ